MDSENASPKSGQGVPICGQVQYLVLCDYNEMIGTGMQMKDIVPILMARYKLSRSSVRKITRNGYQSPKKNRTRKLKFDFNESDINLIDNLICDISKNENKFVTITDLFKKMKNEDNCDISFKNCGQRTFYKILTKIGYKTEDTQRMIRNELINSDAIKNLRIKYLIKKLEFEKYPVIFLDETYIHKNFTKRKVLQPKQKNMKIKQKIGKGLRFSVLHDGGIDGFVDGALLIKSKEELNANKFEEWLQNQLLPNIKETPSVVVFDNAQIHSRIVERQPTYGWKVGAIKDWLQQKKIEFNPKSTKKLLMDLVNLNKTSKKYAVDEMIRAAGHIPLRTPPYCCELNPIENVWAEWKRRLSSNNIHFKPKEFETELVETFKDINDTDHWAKCCRHLIKVEEEFRKNDSIECPISLNIE